MMHAKLAGVLYDPVVLKTCAAGTGVLALATDASITFVGVPAPVLLAGFTGALVSLSFLPQMPARQAMVTVLSSTMVAAYTEPALHYYLELPAGRLDLAAAFMVGLLAQVVVPWIMAGFPGAVERAREWFKRKP